VLLPRDDGWFVVVSIDLDGLGAGAEVVVALVALSNSDAAVVIGGGVAAVVDSLGFILTFLDEGGSMVGDGDVVVVVDVGEGSCMTTSFCGHWNRNGRVILYF